MDNQYFPKDYAEALRIMRQSPESLAAVHHDYVQTPKEYDVFGTWVGFHEKPDDAAIQLAKEVLAEEMKQLILQGDFIFCDNTEKLKHVDPLVPEIGLVYPYTLGLKVGLFQK